MKTLGLVVGIAIGTLGCEGKADGPMQVYDVQPRTGDISGEQAVDILGGNFRTDIGYTVYFGNQRSDSATTLDPKTLRVRIPSVEEPGPVPVTVLADNGPAYRITNAFSYILEAEGAGAASRERGNLRY